MTFNLSLIQWVTLPNTIIAAVLYLSYRITYASYLSSLKHVPGPLLAKVTGVYPFVMDMAGCRAKKIASLHEKYGPVVQVGPNEVSFNAIEAVDLIYGPQSECIKAPWYDSVTRDGVFKLRDVNAHRYRRKQISRAFSPQAALDLEPAIVGTAQSFVELIEERRQKGAMEMRHWFRMLVFDLAGIAFVGSPNGGLQSETAPQFVSDMDNAFLIWDLEGRFPITMWLVEKLPIKALQHFIGGTERLYQYSTEAFDKYVGLYGRASERKDIVSKLLEEPTNDVERLSDFLIKCEIANLTFAATDTTSVVLSFLFWELALNADLQQELRAEIRSVQDKSGAVPPHQSLVNLPLLNAIIQETMRKHSPIPMGLLRQAPPQGLTISGCWVPGETIVSMSSMLAHNNTEHFPDPDSFKPTRWLSTKSDSADINGGERGGTEAMKKLFMPWGRGRHKCAGQILAMVNMRIIVASLILKYNVRLGKDAKPSDMEWDDHFLIMLKRGCYLDFVPV